MLYESVFYSHLDSDASKNEEKRIDIGLQSDPLALSRAKLALNHHHNQHHQQTCTKNVSTKCKKDKSSKMSNSKPKIKNSFTLISNFNELIERSNAERALENSKPDSVINNLLHAKLNIHENSLQSTSSSSLSPNDSTESVYLHENFANHYESHRFNSDYSSYSQNEMEHGQLRNNGSSLREITENFQHFNSLDQSSESINHSYLHGDDADQPRTSNSYYDSHAIEASPSNTELSMHNLNNNPHEVFNFNSSLQNTYYPLATRLSCHLNQLKINNQSFDTFQNIQYQTSVEHAYQNQQSHAYSHRANESSANSYIQMNNLNDSENLYYDEHSPPTANNETYYNHHLNSYQANAIYYNNAPHEHNNYNHQIESHLYPFSSDSSQSVLTRKTDMESLSNVSLDSAELKQAIRLTKKQMKSLHQKKSNQKINTVHQSNKSAKLQKNYLKYLNASTSGYIENQCINHGQEISSSHFVQQHSNQPNCQTMSKRKRKRVLNRLQRAEATMREKRRMLKLNKAFEELRKVLPISEFAKNKLSRAETLKSAIEYIDRMSQMLCI